MAGKPIRSALMAYFEKHPGVNVYLEDILADLGETDRKRIQQGILNINTSGHMKIENLSRGQIYRYSPFAVGGKQTRAARGRRVFEELAEARDGSLIIECEDGTIFKATQL